MGAKNAAVVIEITRYPDAVRHVLERTLIEYFGVAPKDAPEHVVPAGPASDADLPASASPRTEDR